MFLTAHLWRQLMLVNSAEKALGCCLTWRSPLCCFLHPATIGHFGENQLSDMLTSFDFRIMSACAEVFPVTFATDFPSLPSQFSLPHLPVALKEENPCRLLCNLPLITWGGGSGATRNPGPGFCLELPSKTSSLKTWHNFSSKEAGRLSLRASESEVSQRRKNKKPRPTCKAVLLTSKAGPQPVLIKPGGCKTHSHRLFPPFKTAPTCLHYRQGSSRQPHTSASFLCHSQAHTCHDHACHTLSLSLTLPVFSLSAPLPCPVTFRVSAPCQI